MEWISSIPVIIIAVLSIAELILVIINKKDKGLLEVMDIVQDQIEIFMVEAEQMDHLSGRDKKDYVLGKTKIFLENRGLNIPVKEIDRIIENIIKLTKQINK